MKLWNSNRSRWLKAAMDRTTNAIATIDYAHYEVHNGKLWHVEDNTADIGDEAGDFLDIQFTTPAATVGLLHAIFDGYVAAAWLMDLREGQTGGGAGGAALTAYNRRRASTNIHGMSFLKDDGIGTGGTVLFTRNYGSGSGPFASGGTARESNEWILKPATIYQVRAYSTGAVAGQISIDFYLHTDKDTIT